MWFLRIAEELSVGLNSPVEEGPFVLSPHIPERVILLSEAPFFANQRRFLPSRTFTWYHYCSRNWSCSGRPEVRSSESSS